MGVVLIRDLKQVMELWGELDKCFFEGGVLGFLCGIFMVGEREELEADQPFISSPHGPRCRRTLWLGGSHGRPSHAFKST